jgi:hypothetical protein
VSLREWLVAVLAGEATIFGLCANDAGAFGEAIVGIRRSCQPHDKITAGDLTDTEAKRLGSRRRTS